ncbi:MAG: Gmad2 immunoglobulin-like domain-containing protein [Dehalococcoidia bacterium]
MTKRLLLLAAATLLVALAVAACGGDEASDSTATVTPTTTPVATSTGTATPPATLTATSTPTPTATPTTGAPPGYDTSCAAGYPWGQTVGGPFVCIQFPNSGITPTATVPLSGYAGGSFENNVVVALRDENNATLLQQSLTYTAPDIGKPGAWQATVPLPAGPASGSPGRIVVYFTSPRDGQVVALDSIELRFP